MGQANAHPLLDNSTMVGGDPAQREPYGYVHSIPAKSIVTLRNPFVRPRTMKLKIDEQNGFAKFEGTQALELQYPFVQLKAASVKFGDTLTFDLDGYEEIVRRAATCRHAGHRSGANRLRHFLLAGHSELKRPAV